MADRNSTEASRADDKVVIRKIKLDAFDRLEETAAKLQALCAAIAGEGADNFANLNDEVRANYIWAVKDMASDVRRLIGEMDCGNA